MLRREELFEDFVGSLEHALDAEDVSGSAAKGLQTISQPNLLNPFCSTIFQTLENQVVWVCSLALDQTLFCYSFCVHFVLIRQKDHDVKLLMQECGHRQVVECGTFQISFCSGPSSGIETACGFGQDSCLQGCIVTQNGCECERHALVQSADLIGTEVARIWKESCNTVTTYFETTF